MEQILVSGFLIVLSIFDSRECKVPLIFIEGGLVGAFAWVLYRCAENPEKWKWFVFAAFLGALPGGLMLGTACLTDKIGPGDGLVLMGLGVLVGYRECLVLICFSLLFMSVWCIGVLWSKKGNRNTRVPYLPFLTVVYVTNLIM